MGTIATIATVAAAGASIYSAATGPDGSDYNDPSGQIGMGLSEEAMAAANERIDSALGRIDTRTSELKKAEGNLKYRERYLGTPAQARGFTYSDEERDYMSRFGKDKESGGYKAYKQTLDRVGRKELNQNIKKANALMDQAEFAMQRGDMAEAQRLRAEAQALTQAASDAGALTYDERQLSKKEQNQQRYLQSPMAQAMGKVVERSNALMDPESDEYARFYRSLTQGPLAELEAGRIMGERAIASERRTTERQIQEGAAGRGYGRNLAGERAMAARVGDVAATQRANLYLQTGAQAAQVLGNASVFLEQYAPQFAVFAANAGQEFLQNAGGIRAEYQGMLNQLAIAGANLEASFANALVGQATTLGNTGLQLMSDNYATKAEMDVYKQSQITGALSAAGGLAVAGYKAYNAGNSNPNPNVDTPT